MEEIIAGHIQDERVQSLTDHLDGTMRLAECFGVKINDFELMGFYYGLIIGKGLEKGEVEFIKRENLEKSVLKKDEVLETLKKVLL